MPTERHRKVRLWLRDKKAKIVSHEPFTIQLLFETGDKVQGLKFGMDPGFTYAGVSVISDKKEYFRAEITLRTDVSKLMTERKMYRRGRRQRNTRYRPSRFLNRKKTEGRRQDIPPSLTQKIEAHQKLEVLAKKILPIKEKIIEGNSFDISKMKNPDISGKAYQQGEQYGYENTKAYVLARDKYTCYFKIQGEKDCVSMLHVHHIIFKSRGGSDAPSNLLTLCEKHHDMLHADKISLGKQFEHKSYKEATAMNIVRSRLFKAIPDAQMTFGYVTKAKRMELGLKKTHSNDAFVIAGGTNQQRASLIKMAFKRKNNRSLQLNRKGFKPSIRKKRYPIQPKDLVRWEGKLYRVKGCQNKGTYVLLDGGEKKRSPKPIKDIELVFHAKTLYMIKT